MAKRFYDDTTSRAFQDKFWEGRDLDLEKGKPHPRLISAVKRKGFYQTIVDNMNGRIPAGLYWAKDNDALDRSLEALLLQPRFKDDFPEEIRTVARLRLQLMKAQTTPPASTTPRLPPPNQGGASA